MAVALLNSKDYAGLGTDTRDEMEKLTLVEVNS